MDVQARATYRIETFGGLAVTGGTGPLTGAATQRKTLLLLAAIAAAGAQGIGRDKLLGLFWPDSDTDRARHALKQALHILRRDLREPDLIVGVPTLRLNPEVATSDVAEFEEALARGELERAVELHRGPFLDGLWLDGAPEFERWLERERSRLAHANAAALEKLAAAAGAAGDRARAVAWWRRLAATDPLSSRIAVELMTALAAAGDPEAALQHARVHEALVRQELETSPDPAVAALAARIRAGALAPRPATTPPPLAAAPASPAAPAPSSPSTAAPPAVAPVAPSPSATRRSLRRHPVALTLAGALAMVLIAIAAWRGGRRSHADAAPPGARPAAARSIAVLPFVDMSGGNAWFSDGLSEELISALGRIDGLRVAARTSSFALRDARLDARAIADTLGVATLVEGSVRRDGDRLRVTAQLIDARSGYHLWSAEYDRRLEDVFAVQDEIAGSIAGALQLRLADTARTAASRTTNPEAYDLYLRASYLRNRLGRANLLKAIEYYDRALALDPGFASAHAGKASALLPLVYYRHLPRDSGVAAARASLQRALALDERLAEAHAVMGALHFFWEWDWPAAEAELRRAVALDAGDAFAHNALANFLRALGKLDEGIAERQRSLALDPLNVRTLVGSGGDFVAAGQHERAIEQFQRAVDLDSMHPLLLGVGPRLPGGIGEVLEELGRDTAAVAEYARVAARRGASREQVATLRRGFAAGGMPGFWRAWLALFESGTQADPSRALRLSAAWARIGDASRSADWLERAYAERDPGIVYVGIDPAWNRMRSEPRIAAILDRMKLPH